MGDVSKLISLSNESFNKFIWNQKNKTAIGTDFIKDELHLPSYKVLYNNNIKFVDGPVFLDEEGNQQEIKSAAFDTLSDIDWSRIDVLYYMYYLRNGGHRPDQIAVRFWSKEEYKFD